MTKMCTKFKIVDGHLEIDDISLVEDDHKFGIEETKLGSFLHLEGSIRIVEEG